MTIGLKQRGGLKVSNREDYNQILTTLSIHQFQDLQKINEIVKNAPQNSCKRSLSDPDSYEQPTMKPTRKCKKLGRLVSDRQQQESNVNPK